MITSSHSLPICNILGFPPFCAVTIERVVIIICFSRLVKWSGIEDTGTSNLFQQNNISQEQTQILLK